MSERPAVKVENLTKEFENYKIEDINFEVEPHRAISIMGPSGCGKSVVLNMLCGIETPTSGKITYGDQEFLHGIPPQFRKNIGFVFQDNNLLPWRTALKNVLYPLEIQKMKITPTVIGKAKGLLKLVGLQNFSKSYPHELSGGMKQRLAFARALVSDPKILILDQPFGALDAITRKMLSLSLLDIWRNTRIPIILVTNNVDEALMYSSQIHFMGKNPGRILKSMTIEIPDDQRDENIAAHPDYERYKKEAEEIVRALNIRSIKKAPIDEGKAAGSGE